MSETPLQTRTVPRSHVRKEALTRLATKRGILSFVSTHGLGALSGPHAVGGGDDGVAVKKGGSGEAEAGGYGRVRGSWALKRGRGTNRSIFYETK